MATPIAYESQLPALLTSIMGQKTTTGGTSSTSTSSANIDPLMQVFNQTLANGKAGVPEMTALIESIFREGATKVPELTQQFANSTGARVSKNSGLNLALGDLNRQLSTDAAKAILQNQQANNSIAVNAAAPIAQATQAKTTTTAGTTSKTGAATNPLVPVLGGWLLNNFGKQGLSKLKDGLGFGEQGGGTAPVIGGNPSFVTPPGSAMDDGTTAGINEMAASLSPAAQPTFTASPTFSDVIGSTDMGDLGPLAGVTDGGFGGDGNVDFIENVDASGWMPDTSVVSAADSFDFSGMEDFDLGAFFADGGPVKDGKGGANIFKATQLKRNAEAEKDNPTPYVAQPAAANKNVAPSVADQVVKFLRGYADGGVVGSGTAMTYADGGTVRNKNYTGSSQGTVPLTRAINYVGAPANVINNPVTNNPVAPKTQAVTVDQGAAEFGGNMGGEGVTDASNTNGVVDASPETLGGLAVSGLTAALGLPGIVGTVANSALGLTPAPMSPVSMAMAALGQVTGLNNSMSSQSQMALDAVPQADIDAQTAATVASMEGGLSGPAAGGAADAGNDAGQGIGGVDFADGGMVHGPGTGTSDSVRVRSKQPGGKDIAYSAGEYVIPADVVRFFGTKHLDRMIAQVHQPAGV